MEDDEELSSFLRGQTVRAVNVVDLEEGFEKEVYMSWEECVLVCRRMQRWPVMRWGLN